MSVGAHVLAPAGRLAPAFTRGAIKVGSWATAHPRHAVLRLQSNIQSARQCRGLCMLCMLIVDECRHSNIGQLRATLFACSRSAQAEGGHTATSCGWPAGLHGSADE